MIRRYVLTTLLALWAVVALAQFVLAAGTTRMYVPMLQQRRSTPLPQPTASGTVTATATRTAAPIVTRTATATSTASPTVTSTTAPAPQCVPIMPISVPGSALSDGSFIDPGVAGDFGMVDGRTYRRLYFEQPQAKLLSLRWQAALSSSEALATSLSGDGNIYNGFEEVPEWPSTSLPPPDVYPLFPGQINAGDWLYTTNADVSARPVSSALAVLSNTQRLVALPIYDTIIGNQANIFARMTGLQQFRIQAYGRDPLKGSYLTLVAYGEPGGTPCGNPQLTLSGKVVFWPEYEGYSGPTCIPKADGEWKGTISSTEAGSVQGLSYPVVGQVTLYDPATGVAITLDLRVDQEGILQFALSDLPTGLYDLSAYLFYRHPLDPPGVMARRYSLIDDWQGNTSSSVSIELWAESRSITLPLRLFGRTCAGV